uniref:Uncharacterized protein n=1 Tax=Pithovirus LCPAC104 TaxID=2506589 RepID=A0A481Z600_9VIRU|nr:MAG: hypothetical protein LCPAC104_00060 [Pithovirus LCPAC104]
MEEKIIQVCDDSKCYSKICNKKCCNFVFKNLDCALNSIKICDNEKYIIKLHKGLYKNLNICFPGTKEGQIKIIGDCRPVVGTSFIHDSYWNSKNVEFIGGGQGSICSLSGNSGSDTITVIATLGNNPDFMKAKVKNGDKLIIRHANNVDRFLEYEIIEVGSTTLKISPNLLDNLGNQGDSMVIQPKVKISCKINIETPVTLIGIHFTDPPLIIKNSIVNFKSCLIEGGEIGIDSINSRLIFDLKNTTTILNQKQNGIFSDDCQIPEYNCVIMMADGDNTASFSNGGLIVFEQTQLLVKGDDSRGFFCQNTSLERNINNSGEPPVIYLEGGTGIVIRNSIGLIFPRFNTGLRIFGPFCSRYMILRNSNIAIIDFNSQTKFENIGINITNNSIIIITVNKIDISEIISFSLLNSSSSKVIFIINPSGFIKYENSTNQVFQITNSNFDLTSLGMIEISKTSSLFTGSDNSKLKLFLIKDVIIGDNSTIISIDKNSEVHFFSIENTKLGDNSKAFVVDSNSVLNIIHGGKIILGKNSRVFEIKNNSKLTSNSPIILELDDNSDIALIDTCSSGIIDEITMNNPKNYNTTAITVSNSSQLCINNATICNFLRGFLATEMSKILVSNTNTLITFNGGVHYESTEDSKIKTTNVTLEQIAFGTTGFKTSNGGKISVTSWNSVGGITQISPIASTQTKIDLIGNYIVTYSSGTVVR